MKKVNLIFIIVFVIQSHIAFSQSEDSLSFIDFGIGVGNTPNMHGAINLGLSRGLYSYLASFTEHNMIFGHSGIMYHELNIKIGPYYSFSKNTFLSISAGLSFIFNPFKSDIDQTSEYNINSNKPYSETIEDNYLVNVPVQIRLNIRIYNKSSIGLKGTYNKMLNKYVENKSTVLIFYALGF